MSLADLAHELKTLRTSYPAFVSGGSLPAGEVPVFVYHTIKHEEFALDLRFLQENGYRTLSMPEYLAVMRGESDPGSKAVLLTIDDARSSVWHTAFPLLREYQCRATVFAITGWTPEHPARQSLAARAPDADPDRDGSICSWDELRRMHDSGWVSIESHSSLHRRVFVDRELRDIIGRAADFSPLDPVHGAYLELGKDPRHCSADDYVGLPLFGEDAFFSDRPRYRVDPDALEPFRLAVRQLQEKSTPHARRGLTMHARRLIPDSAFTVIDLPEAERQMADDISLARDLLRERLGDQGAGQTLCLPFTLGGEAVVRACGAVGIEALFWGVRVDRRYNRPGMDLRASVRLKSDFVQRLPGSGRKALPLIYLAKVGRRLRGERPY